MYRVLETTGRSGYPAAMQDDDNVKSKFTSSENSHRMKIVDLYNDDASDFWFALKKPKGSIHENLKSNGFRIVEREELGSTYANLEVPAEWVQLSWGSTLPCPNPQHCTTCIAHYPDELTSATFANEPLDKILNRWMASMSGQEKYIVSLSAKDYFFATAPKVCVEDVLTVSSVWKIDSFIGVFDDSGMLMFIFDIEFGAIYLSFNQSVQPAGIEDFSATFNEAFREVFVRDAKLRTGANPARAEEYYRKVALPAIDRG